MELNAKIAMTHPALLRAIAEDLERGPRPDPTTVLRSPLAHPALGAYWKERGGVFIGMIRGAPQKQHPDRYLVVADGKDAQFKGEWGNYGKDIGATDARYGLPNTQTMAEHDSAIAKQVLALEHHGFKDWYIPARQELALCWMNSEGVFAKEWYWSSTQYSSFYAFFQDFGDGFQGDVVKYGGTLVRPVRSFTE